MFEKEAEEYVDLSGNRNYTERAFKDGAEFGYNKANEWHYVKDGDLPKDENVVTVIYHDCDKYNTYCACYDIIAEHWLYYNFDDGVWERLTYEVIAWKEIVLPKESE